VHHVEKCIVLEKLSIEHIRNLEKAPVNLLRICAPLRNLQDLSLNKIKIMPFEEPHSNMWVGLKTLTLNFCEFSEGLPYCPELKKLDIQFPRCHTEGYSLNSFLKMEEIYIRCMRNACRQSMQRVFYNCFEAAQNYDIFILRWNLLICLWLMCLE